MHSQAIRAFCFLIGCGVVSVTQAAAPFEKLAARYRTTIQPIIKRYCAKCHNDKKQEAELNLVRFRSLTIVRRDPKVWQKVRYMLVNREMPPKKSKQPSATEARQLLTWIREYLQAEAVAAAGDPGRVVLRRLNNVEYNNSVRDLTGHDFRPSGQFPADSAAGEGFTNTGDSLVMSPALLDKYLAAARQVSRHVVLVPDGFRFSRAVTRRDWTHEILDEIRAIHERHTTPDEIHNRGAATQIKWGKVDLRSYIRALVKHRTALQKVASVKRIAALEKLNARYLGHLAKLVDGREPLTPLLAGIAARLRKAELKDVPGIVASIDQWQKRLWKFKPVGQFFEPGQQPESLLVTKKPFRFQLESGSSSNLVNVNLTAGDAGDGNDEDYVVWQNPRFVGKKGMPEIRLRDVRELVGRLAEVRRRTLVRTADYLDAAAEPATGSKAGLAAVAKKRRLDSKILQSWVDYLYFQRGKPPTKKVDLGIKLFTGKRVKVQGQKFINGWAGSPTSPLPTLLVNSSNRQVRIPGIFKPKTVFVHPSPSHFVAATWKSPIRGLVHIQASIEDVHPECGNGQSWTLLWQHGGDRQRIAAGEIGQGKSVRTPVFEDVFVRPGDLITLAIGPRNRNHGCDATAIDLTLKEMAGKKRSWGLAKDNVENIHAGNPHPDRHGNAAVWHFYSAPTGSLPPTGASYLPIGSLLSKWRTAIISKKAALAKNLARQVQSLLVTNRPPRQGVDRALYKQLRSVGSPLFRSLDIAQIMKQKDLAAKRVNQSIGLSAKRFVKDPDNPQSPATSLVAQAPHLIRIQLPADLLSGYEFVVDAKTPANLTQSTVQVRASRRAKVFSAGIVPSEAVLVSQKGRTRSRLAQSFNDFRRLFPSVMCCRTIVPLDNVVTLVQFHREDEHLSRLLLSDRERARLDRLWSELRFVSQDALKIHDTFDLFQAFASQVGKVKLFEPLRKGIAERAKAFRERMSQCEPAHLKQVDIFAARAFRRPLTASERVQLQKTYRLLRKDKQTHDEAIRGLVMRVLVSPRFLYRIEHPQPGKKAGPVSSHELATRLSYFLWSTAPDSSLLSAARDKQILVNKQLVKQTRRMLGDDRVRALATEFACQWLGFRGFDKYNDKNERQYPTFKKLRADMYEESVRFFTDLFQRDGSILDIVDADHTFVNGPLARHYGLDVATSRKVSSQWRRVKGMKARSRGGILGMSVLLARQSGATRTSPVLRGNWIVETLLGERIPDPPATVPELPDAISRKGKTVRQLTERHVQAPQCARCHVRIDPYGFALESFDAIGRFRTKDLVNQPVDTRAKLRDGTKFQGLAGLRRYILKKRKNDFLKQFCRKLLGFSLGRAVQLSDEPLIEKMTRQLAERQYRFSAAVETIVRSKQFRYHRGLAATRQPNQ